MKKIILGIALMSIIVLSLTGCGIKYPDLERDAIGFQMSNFIDESDPNESGYLTFEYNGRTYMPYGSLKGTIKEEDIDKCIGYIIQDENSSSVVDKNDKNTRIYTLSSDKDNNFLMEYYIGTTLMNQPSFYRAIDTKNKNITIPKFINDLDYYYWK